MEIEDAADLFAVGIGDLFAQLLEINSLSRRRLVQAVNFVVKLIVGNRPFGNEQILRVQHDSRADRNAGRNTDSFLDLHFAEVDSCWLIVDSQSAAINSLSTSNYQLSFIHLHQTYFQTARRAY